MLSLVPLPQPASSNSWLRRQMLNFAHWNSSQRLSSLISILWMPLQPLHLSQNWRKWTETQRTPISVEYTSFERVFNKMWPRIAFKRIKYRTICFAKNCATVATFVFRYIIAIIVDQQRNSEFHQSKCHSDRVRQLWRACSSIKTSYKY